MLRHPFKIIGLLLAVILVMVTCSGSGDLFVEESIFNIFKKSSYYPHTSAGRGENISVSIINLKPVPATYAFDTSFVSPPSWLKIDANTGIISGKVPKNASVSTTKYVIKITGRGQYSHLPEQRLDFVLALKIADFPNPLRLNVEGMILKKHSSNTAEKSGNSMVIDANNSKLTVRYSYSANNETAQPSWLSLNQNTGEITVNNADKDDLPDVGDKKIYKIKITGTGIYEGKTSEIDFIITAAALEIPDDISYDNTTIAKGSDATINLNDVDGFTATYAFATTPAKPPWLNIDASTGAISGTVPPSEPVGTTIYTINIRGTGAYKAKTTSKPFTLTVASAALPTTLAYYAKIVARGSYMSQTIRGVVGTSSFTYAFAATPAKPTWLSIDTNTGAISGTVPASESVGTTTYKITVTGRPGSIYAGETREIDFTLRVTPAALPTTLAYDSKTVARGSSISHNIKGGSGSSFTYAFAATPAKPAWLSIDANTGAISGTVPASESVGTTTYKITVNGGSGSIYAGATREIDFTLTVTSVALPTTLAYHYSRTVARGSYISQTIREGVGTSSFTYAFAATPAKPAWLSINANTGAISGTVPASESVGTTAYKITVNGRPGSIYAGATQREIDFTLTVTPAALPTTLVYYPKTVARSSYMSQTIKGRGGISNLTYAFAATPAKPTWLSINANTGAISGTVPASESVGETTYKITVNGRPGSIYAGATQREIDFTLTVTPVALPTTLVYYPKTVARGSSISQTIKGRGGISSFTYAFAATPAKPTWLSINANTGAISGTVPASASVGETTYKITVNGRPGSVYAGATQREIDFTLTVTPAALPTTLAYDSKTVARGSSISQTIKGRGGISSFTYAFAATPAKPAWLSINANTGAISGTVPASESVGTTTYKITVNGGSGSIYAGATREIDFTLTVTPAALPTTLAYDSKTVARSSYMSHNINGRGGISSFTYAFAATPAKPTWLSINANTGAISGTVPASESLGTTTYKITVNGGSGSIYAGATREIDFTLTVSSLDACSAALSVTCSQFAQAYTKASNTDSYDYFGYSVALSSDGNTLAVSAYIEQSNATGVGGDQSNNSANNSGAVYVFTRSSTTTTTWSQQAYIKASNTGAGDYFGTSVALSSDGNTLAVGAHGEDSNATGVGGDQSNNSASNSGAVYVFTRSTTTTTTWSQQAYIKASNTGASDYFGYSVALSSDGNTLAVGAYLEDSDARGVGGDQSNNSAGNSGAVYVFTRSTTTTTWSQQAYTKASNTGASDFFGYSVALSSDGNTLAVGARDEDSNARGVGGDQSNNSAIWSGAVYVFTRSTTTTTTTWSQQAYIKASNTETRDYFGTSVALSSDGNTLAVGAIHEDSNATGVGGDQSNNSASNSGAVYVFTRSTTTTTTTWSQQAYIKASNTGDGDEFGYSVALSSDGNTLAVGARDEDSNATGVNGDQTNNSASNSGAVYVFTRSTTTTTTWSQQAYTKASNTGDGDEFGYSVALSSDGNTLAVGAYLEDSNARGVGGDQGNNSASNSGAVYIRRIAP